MSEIILFGGDDQKVIEEVEVDLGLFTPSPLRIQQLQRSLADQKTCAYDQRDRLERKEKKKKLFAAG